MCKKLLTVLTLFFLLCSVTACNNSDESSEQQDAEDQSLQLAESVNTENNLITEEPLSAETIALNKYNLITEPVTFSLSSFEDSQIDADITVTMDIVMETEGERITMPMVMTGNVKSIRQDGIIKYAGVADIGYPPGTAGDFTVEMYYDGENYYYEADGEQVLISAEEFLQEIENLVSLPLFDESAIKSTETINAGDNLETTLIIDGNKIKEYMLEAMGEYGQLETGAEADINDMTLIILTTQDDIPLSVSIEMSMSMNVSDPNYGQFRMDFIMIINYTIINYGSGVEIDFSKIS